MTIANLKKKIKKFFFKPKSVTLYLDKILKNENLTIVQIGSNDGVTVDPIFQLFEKNNNWKGLFVEPIPYLFKKLKSNYKNSERCIFENAAINDGSKQLFYHVDKEVLNHFDDLPNWYDQLGSFKKENIVKHLDGKLENFIIETLIEGITVESLLLKHKINEINLLHIDTEGYDWKILSQLNLKKYSPNVILFEHKHLSFSEKTEAVNFLNNDYFLYDISGDFLCIVKTLNYKIKNLKEFKL